MNDNKLCPFRKKIIHYAGMNTGDGYPVSWESEEEFLPCLKEECEAYYENTFHRCCKLISNNAGVVKNGQKIYR